MNSLLVVVKSHLFPQFVHLIGRYALAGVAGGRGEFSVVNRGWAGTVPGRDDRDGRAIHRKSSEVAAAVTHNSDSDS